MVGEFSGPFPGYNATIPHDCAPFPRIMQENGYLTGGFGKWHLTPDDQQGFSGPFDRWPTRLGFDYFWGFLGGEAGQYDPLIAENQKIIGVPEAKDGEKYYFQDDLADRTINWLHGVRSEKPTTPWFAYVATGCSHAPHHVPREWSDKYRGAFDAGGTRCASAVLRAAEGARRRPRRRGAAAAQRRVPDVGLARRDAQAPLRAADGGLRGLLRERRLEHRADHRRGRGAGRARQHGRDLDLGRQRREHGGHADGHVQRADDAERDPAGRRAADRAHLQARRPRGLGRRPARPALRRRLGMGRQRPVRLGQAGRLAPRRHPEPARRALADGIGDAGAVREPLHARQRRRRDVLDLAGIPMPDDDRRRRPAAVRRRHVRRLASSDAAAPERHTQQYYEILGNRGMYKDGWLLTQRLQRIPWSLDPEELREFGPGWDPDGEPDPALLPARRLHAVEGPRRRPSGEGARAQRAVLGRGRGATTSCRCWAA